MFNKKYNILGGNMGKSKHKYIFYIYPQKEKEKGDFRVTGHSKPIKEWCKKNNRKFDYKQIF